MTLKIPPGPPVEISHMSYAIARAGTLLSTKEYSQVGQMTPEQLQQEYQELKDRAESRCTSSKVCSVVCCPLNCCLQSLCACLFLYPKHSCHICNCIEDQTGDKYCLNTVCDSGCWKPAPPPASTRDLDRRNWDVLVCCTFIDSCNGETIYNYLLPAERTRFLKLKSEIDARRRVME